MPGAALTSLPLQLHAGTTGGKPPPLFRLLEFHCWFCFLKCASLDLGLSSSSTHLDSRLSTLDQPFPHFLIVKCCSKINTPPLHSPHLARTRPAAARTAMPCALALAQAQQHCSIIVTPCPCIVRPSNTRLRCASQVKGPRCTSNDTPHCTHRSPPLEHP